MITIIFLQIIINAFFFLKFKKISKIVNIFDKPDQKLKKHKFNIPLLGGIIMFLNLFLIYLCNFFFDYELVEIEFSLKKEIAIIFLLLSFFSLGLFDDKYGLGPNKKLIYSIFISILTITFDNNLLLMDLKLSFIGELIPLNNFSYIFTIFCFVILLNALNFYDGINGQSTIFFIICFTYLAYRSPIIEFYIFIIVTLIFILFMNLHNKILWVIVEFILQDQF